MHATKRKTKASSVQRKELVPRVRTKREITRF